MLRFLGIRHLSVIDHLEVDFEPGLNILTGETGAGKSVLIEAIDLLMGGRASADLVRTGEDTATIQAIFERPDGREVIVRREVSAQGRSRAFVDDTLATTVALRELGASLVDLHGQHEHQSLLDPAEHIDLLDTFAGHGEAAAAVGARFDLWRAAAGALERTRLDDREKRARIEMAAFQLQDIEKVAPLSGEDERLAADRHVLANADRLSRWSSEAYAALYEGETAVLSTLGGVWRRIGELAAMDARFAPYLDQRDDVKSRLEDLAFFLRSYAADLDASPQRLDAIEDRLAALDRLKKKHGPALDDVLRRQDTLREELAALEASDERAVALEAQAAGARAAFAEAAEALSAGRRTAAGRLGRALEAALSELAMPKSRVDIRVRVAAEPAAWTRHGIDDVEFFLSPNPGEELRPLARIASGGELSRIMLALRTLAAPSDRGRTLIFDEVDAGIGGAAADAVGARLQRLGQACQVLCITHLPHIAARAGTHFLVAKSVRGGRTLATLTKLDDSGREGEVARMIAGAEVSPKVLASARELIAMKQLREDTAKDESESPSRGKAKGRRGGS
jgi:DNA repair protein RecN (Recombination protein N)